MASTYSFTVARDDIINAALRKTNRYASGDTIPSQDITDCAFALNVLTKALVMEGLPLWAVQTLVVPLVAGNATYQIGPSATGTGALVNAWSPIKITDAFIRNAAGNDTPLVIESRYDYNTLGSKSSQGVPNQIWYWPMIINGVVNGVLTTYDVPADSLSSIYLTCQRQLADFNLSTDNPDFPQEWYLPLVWLLANEISVDYECSAVVMQRIQQMAEMYKQKVTGWGQDTVPVRFTPTTQWGRR